MLKKVCIFHYYKQKRINILTLVSNAMFYNETKCNIIIKVAILFNKNMYIYLNLQGNECS